MKLSNKTQALLELLAPAVKACNVNLWGVEFLSQGKRSVLRIFIDKDKDENENQEQVLNELGEIEKGRGVGVEDCVRVSHQVSALLDVHDPIAGEYSLEVSSPGLDRQFFYIEQMTSYIGETIAIRLIHAVDNRRKFQAKLLGVDIEHGLIQVEVDQHVLDINVDNIDKVNLVYHI